MISTEARTTYREADSYNELLDGDIIPHSREVLIECEDGFEIEDGIQQRTCEFGKWSPGELQQLPKCTLAGNR